MNYLNKKYNFFSLLKNPIYFFIFLGVVSIFLALNTYFIVMLPGSDGYMCIPGGNITTFNILFALFLSLSTALLITSMIYIFQMPKICSIGTKMRITGVTGVSTISGLFTVFCTVCTLPVFSLLGISIGFSFFTFYNGWFKALSIVLSVIGLIVINRYLKKYK